MLVPTIKLLEFSDKNWETYERLLIFWSIFWLFFLLSKVSKMKFHRKSFIYKNTTLYDIDFPRKIGFLRFFLRKFLLTVLLIFHREYTQIFKKSTFPYTPIYYIFMIRILCSFQQSNYKNFRIKIEKLMKVFWFFGPFFDYFFIVQSFKNEILSKILDIQKYNILWHWLSSKNWIFAIFFKKVSFDGFTHFSSKIHPKFSKNRLFHIPQYIIYLWSEFYARSNNQTIRIFG